MIVAPRHVRALVAEGRWADAEEALRVEALDLARRKLESVRPEAPEWEAGSVEHTCPDYLVQPALTVLCLRDQAEASHSAKVRAGVGEVLAEARLELATRVAFGVLELEVELSQLDPRRFLEG